MEIKACAICGSKNLGMPPYSLTEIRISLSGQYYCKNCGNVGFPMIFDNEEDYKRFLELKTEKDRL